MRPSLGLKALLVALFPLSSCVVHATFIESFALPSPNAPATAPQNQLPYLWQQSGEVKQGGRGATGTTGSVMVLEDSSPTAETVLLKWDKTTPAELIFYAAKEDDLAIIRTDCGAVVRLLYSEDGINWSKQWEQDITEWDPKGFEPISVTLPLVEGASKFSVKWVYTQPTVISQNCYKISIDDITFPAEAPGPAGKPAFSPQPNKPKPTMPPGVAPPPFPATFAGTCTWAATYCGAASTRNVTNSTGRGANATGRVKTGSNSTAVTSSTEAITSNTSTSSTTDESVVEEATATSAPGITVRSAPADPSADDPAVNLTAAPTEADVVETTAASASPNGVNALGQGRKLRQLV